MQRKTFFYFHGGLYTIVAASALSMAVLPSYADSRSAMQNVQQQAKVKGQVTDVNGEPIIGATVTLKGTSQRTVTDLDGKYELPNTSKGIIVVSYVGYKTAEQAVSAGRFSTVKLEEANDLLNEVVVVGYGAVRKSDLTGAVSSVSTKELVATGLASAAGAMQGAVAGVNIQRSSGKPGSSYNILIRGLNTVNGSTSPLIVIDGVPGAQLENINPDDIEKIDILKDASSTAIYGSRATNGVVIVTTKKGTNGAPQVSYSGSVGFRDYWYKPDMMNGEQYVRLAREYGRATKGKGEYVDDSAIFSSSELKAIETGSYTDWFDEMTSTGLVTSHSLSVTGGTDKVKYATSAGFYNEDGTLDPQFYRRYNVRAAVDVQPNKYVKLGASLYATHTDQETGNEDGLQTILRLRPTYGRYNYVTGEEELKYGSGQWNPYVTQKNQSWRYKKYDVLANAYLEIDPIENLSLRTTFSPDIQFVDYGMWADKYTKRMQGSTNMAWNQKTTTTNWVWDNLANYKFDLGKDHHFDVTGVFSMTKYVSDNLYGTARTFSFDSHWYALQNGSANISLSSGYTQTSLMSWLGRLNYNYKGKYLATVSYREDGSSKLAEGNKWGGFFAAALAWRISEETFMKQVEWIDNLKLRVSMGQSGNDNVSAYQTQGQISGAQYYTFGTTDVIGNVPNNLRNMDLGWERTTEYNIGMDFAFLRSRISGSIEFYNRETNDLIMNKTVPITSGYSSVKANVGSVRNRGFEFTLNTVNIETKNFRWSTSLNIAHNKNEITDLQYKEDLSSRGKSLEGMQGDYANLWIIGQPVDINYNLITIGVWQTDEAEEAAKYGCKPGQYKVLDLNGDGAINDEDRVIDGKRTPSLTGGMTNNFVYKNFDLSIGSAFQTGAKLRNQFLVSYCLENNNMNLNNLNRNYWTPENPTNEWAQPGNMGAYRSKAGSWGQPEVGGFSHHVLLRFLPHHAGDSGLHLPQEMAGRHFPVPCAVLRDAAEPFPADGRLRVLPGAADAKRGRHGLHDYQPNFRCQRIFLTTTSFKRQRT